MSYINTSNGVKLWINNVDYTEYLLQGNLSDDSVYSSNIIATRGQIVLGTSESILDFNKTQFPIGSNIDIWVALDGGIGAKHPKGRLYVMNSSSDLQALTTTLEVGCSLAFLAEKESQYSQSVRSLFEEMLTSDDRKLLLINQYTLSNLNSYLDCLGEIIYQDRWGYIQKLDVFGNDALGGGVSSPKLTSFDKYTAISIDSLSSTAIENDIAAVTVEARVPVPVLSPKDPEENGVSIADGPNPSLDYVTHATSVAVGSFVNFTVNTTDLAEGSVVYYRARIAQSALKSKQSAKVFVDANGLIQFSIKLADEIKFDTVSNPDANKFVVVFEADVKLQDPGPSATPEEVQDYQERLRSLVLLSSEITITGFTEEGEDEDLEGFVPEPFIGSILFRNIQVPSVHGNYTITEEPDSDAALTDSSNPLTGTLNEPVQYAPPNQDEYAREELNLPERIDVEFPPPDLDDEPEVDRGTGVGYSWHLRGEVDLIDKTIEEKVVSGRSIHYHPKNRQVLKETTFEWCSAATYAKDANTTSAQDVLEYIGFVAERTNNLLQKANQCYDERDKFKKTVTFVNGVTGVSTEYANSTYYYWQYQGDAYYYEAKLTLKKIERLRTELVKVLEEGNDHYYLSNATVRENSYDRFGKVIAETTTTYVHPLATPRAKSYEVKVEASFWPVTPTLPEFAEGQAVAVETIRNLPIRITENKYKRLNSNPPTNDDSLNLQLNNLVPINKTVTRYAYAGNYVQKTELYRDFYDGSQDYRRVNYSSTGSTSPELPDRIIEDITAEDAIAFEDVGIDEFQPEPSGGGFDPSTIGGSVTSLIGDGTGGILGGGTATIYCNEETEDEDISATIKTRNQTSSINGGWFGTPTPRIKKVNFPLEFVPIRSTYDPVTETCDLSFDPTQKLLAYKRLVKRYAYNISRKVKGDNLGFRVTEKMRPEVFGYYPFYPIKISLQTVNKGYASRAGSSTWVFNQQETICSFDCLVTGAVSVTSYPTETAVFGLLEDLYPSQTSALLTPQNYFADAGDFTTGTTSGGLSAGSGDFDTGLTSSGVGILNAGDFDTGATVVFPQPSATYASTANGDTDPETEMGTTLVDENGTSVDVDTLPTPVGSTIDLVPLDIDLRLITSILVSLETTVALSLSWNFGTIEVPLDSEFDAGTITSATAVSLDFGTIATPLIPVLSSYIS